MAQVGVLHRENVGRLTTPDGRPFPAHELHAGDVADIAAAWNVPQVWIHPSAHDLLRLPVVLPPGDPAARAREGYPHRFAQAGPRWRVHPAGLAHFLTLTSTVGAHRQVDIGLAAYDHAAGLATASPAELGAALELYAAHVGLPYRWSPGAVAGRLIAAVHRKGRPLGPSTPEPPAPMVDPMTEADFRWSRPPTAGERRAAYVHALDANGRYLASCAGLELGMGLPTYVHAHGGQPLTIAGKVLPGYYRADLAPQAGPLPDPFDARGLGRSGWVTAPTLELARELGAIRRVHAAWVWRDHSRYLVPWYERLRDARRSLQELTGQATPGAVYALGLVKRTYTHGIGYLAGRWREPGDDLYRPDWRHAIIARSRANLYRALRRASAAPFAVDVDQVYVALDSPDARLAGLPLGIGLGEWKHTATLTWDGLGLAGDEPTHAILDRLGESARAA